MKRFFVLSMLFLSVAHAQAPVQDLSIHDAVQLAIENNPSFRQSLEKITQTETEVPLARALIFPTLTAVGDAQRVKDANLNQAPRFDGKPFNQYDASLRLTQIVFQMGTLSGISAAQKDVGISKLNAQISARNLMSATIQAYYQVVLSSRNIETLLRQQRIVKESLGVAQHRERNGRGQLLDVLQVKTQLALLDGQIATARNQLAIAVANLANTIGGTTKNLIRVKDHLEAPDITEVDQDVDLKNYTIPEIESDLLSIQRIDDQRQVMWGQNLPNISLFGNYNFTNYKQSDLFDDSANSWNFGLQLTIPLFSGLSTIYQNRSLLSQRLQLEFDKKNVENQVAYQQITSRKNLETAKDSIVTGIDALKLAEASSNEARRNFRNATIDFVQLLTVEQSFVQAEQTLNASRYNYITALANYYAASGQDMAKLVALLERTNK
ncbi:MAG: TolC family protein [Bdellovibrionales bacterium]|nr:TolC family protein [Bdellovibrionales bacterium]